MPEELELSAEIESPEVEVEAEVEEGSEGERDAEVETSPTLDQSKSAADVWRNVKERLKDAPDLHRQVKKALHFMEDANRRMPDGIAKAVERLGLISQLDDNPSDPDYIAGSTPIEEVISNTLAERSFWRDFDNAFQAGDAKVVNQMIEANPASFQKMIPEAMDRYADLNPDGFSSYVCKSVSSYLNSAQIPLQLALLERVLPPDSTDPGLKTVIEAFKTIKGVIEEINTTAKKPIEVKAGESVANPATQDGNHDQREMNLLHDEWLRDIRPRSEQAIVAEVQRISPKGKFTATEINSIRSAVKEEINARVRVLANRNYQQKVKSLLKAKNKTAYAMTVESEHRKIIPGAVKRAVDDVLSKRRTNGVKKPAVKAEIAVRNGAVTQPANSRFEYVAQSPTRLGLKVDFRKTSNEMLARNEAFVVGRTNPVKWKR